MNVDIIMYHYVRDSSNSKYPRIKSLDINEFISQIEYLQKHYQIISIEDFLFDNNSQNKKQCMLTFDDGYKEHHNIVMNILLNKGLKGCFFITSDTVQNRKILDANKIHLILASAGENIIFERIKFHYNNLNNSGLSIKSYIDQIDFSSRFDSKETILIKRLLQKVLPEELRSKICDSLLLDFVEQDKNEIIDELYLNKEEIKEMINYGMHIGGHTLSHKWMSSLSYNEQETEIKGTFKFLENIYSKKFIPSLCYPFGDYNSDTISLMNKYKFKAGFTCDPRGFNKLTDSTLEIPRYDTNDFPK